MKKQRKKAATTGTKEHSRFGLLFWLPLIVGAVLGAILGYFAPGIIDTIEVKILGKPEIIVNVNELHPLELASEYELEYFNLIFFTANGQGTIVATQTNQPELNQIFGDVLIPTDLCRNGSKVDYSITILNNGDRTAKDLRITFSGDMLQTDYEHDVDQRIDFVSCGGSNCEIRIEELAPNDRTGMFVEANTPPIANVSISAKGTHEAFVNYRRFYVRTISEGESIDIFLDNTQTAELPTLNQNPNRIRYYYSPQENRWITY
jgi:hypothetical protein